MLERTLIILKPDAIARGLIGEITSRFEKVGLKIVAAKLLKSNKNLTGKHYPLEREEFIKGMGQKTLDNYHKLGVDVKKEFGTEDAYELGKIIREWLMDMMTSGPVFAMVLEGPHAVELVRKICGPTLPLMAAPGTIRGDYSFDSSYLANVGKRGVKNLIHASGSLEEAKYEIPLWFTTEEILPYERVEEKIMR